METNNIYTQCCIVGGGPAAMMTGFLLARAGIEVVVLEKHNDFLRDFRGDTIHPSTFELMHETGLLEEFLQLPHQEAAQVGAQFNDDFFVVADFTHLQVAKPRLGLMPQWDFLSFLQQKASAYSSFKLMMNAKVTDVVRTNNLVTGVVADTKEGTLQVHAAVVIAADGRHSIIREKAGFEVISSGAPIDVLWFKLAKQAAETNKTFGRFFNGKMLVLIDRNDYYQCGFVIAKGQYEKIAEKGLPAFKDDLRQMVPFLKDAVDDLKSWSDVSVLSVVVDHLKKWFDDGVICIGDAAHAMSPVGGVGINLAIQDAVATANTLYPALKAGKKIDINVLKKIQERRAFPARAIQRMQVAVHKNLLQRQLLSEGGIRAPRLLRLINRFPYLQRFPARLIGMGIRREHIRTPERVG